MPQAAIIFSVITFPPFIFIDYKLYRISKKYSRRNAVSPQRKSRVDLKNISTCLLAAACLFFLSITVGVYIAFALYNTSTTNAELCYFWAKTIAVMNSTFNSLIFFWKNKVLRAEGMKILKTLKGFLFQTEESMPTVTRQLMNGFEISCCRMLGPSQISLPQQKDQCSRLIDGDKFVCITGNLF